MANSKKTPVKNQAKDASLAYNRASKRLRDAHLDEFRAYQQAEMDALGYPQWRPPMTKTEKAEKRLNELLEENPELREKFSMLPTK